MKAWINNKEFEFQEGETILHAAKRLGIFIPTLCAYLPLNHTPGTCRVCLVEVTDDRGRGQIVTACTTPLTNGMRVQTRTKRIREMQRWQVAWIFSDHDQDCASCSRHGNCELQDLALYVGLQHNSCNGRFTEKRPLDWSANGLVRDANKCIRCYRCVEVCRQVQGVSALTMDNIGNECGVGIAGAKLWDDSAKCVQCGQCSLVCPTGALSEKDQTEVALDWFSDPEIKTVVAFAPAVRVTLGDAFQVAAGTNLEKRIVTALKQLGADYVCDINCRRHNHGRGYRTARTPQRRRHATDDDELLPWLGELCRKGASGNHSEPLDHALSAGDLRVPRQDLVCPRARHQS